MEEEIINKAKYMLTNADTGTNDCKQYINGFMDGVEYAIKALRQPLVSGSLLCHHNFIQKDTYWKSCTHCGMLAPLGQ